MMRREASGRIDRVLAAVETVALGTWLGALVGFAFVFAPLAFRIVAPLDVGRFATLTATSLAVLSTWGYVLGGVAVVVTLARAAGAGDRVWDAARAAVVVFALCLVAFEQRAIVPPMLAATDVRSDAYRALHQRSTAIYGGAVLLVAAALVLAAVRRDT